MRQETDMLRVRSEFWRMWKRISGSGLECTDSMLSDHFNQTMSPAKTNCTLKCILFYFHWIHLNFNLKGEIFKCVHLDATWGHLRSCTHTELCKNSLKNDTASCAAPRHSSFVMDGTPFQPQLSLLHLCCQSLRLSNTKIGTVRLFSFLKVHLSQRLVCWLVRRGEMPAKLCQACGVHRRDLIQSNLGPLEIIRHFTFASHSCNLFMGHQTFVLVLHTFASHGISCGKVNFYAAHDMTHTNDTIPFRQHHHRHSIYCKHLCS